MSSFKKRAKTLQKTHKERGQPSARKHLGLLEKRKDYLQRAKSYKKKAAQLKQLYEKARNRNPDEFYYKMVNSKLTDGCHVISQPEENYTEEELRLMKTQDLKYVQMKLNIERKKIERLQSTLHLTSEGLRHNIHTIFVDEEDEEGYSNFEDESVSDKREVQDSTEDLSDQDIHSLDKDLLEQQHDRDVVDTSLKLPAYRELSQRLTRSRELERLTHKMQLEKHLLNKKERRVRIPGSDNRPVTYRWFPERKK